jgi:hypothetical protein
MIARALKQEQECIDIIKEIDFCEKAEKIKEKERLSKMKGFLIKK